MRILTARWPGLALVLSLSSMIWLPIGWAKGPHPPSLPYSANVNLTARLSALAVRKNQLNISVFTDARQDKFGKFGQVKETKI